MSEKELTIETVQVEIKIIRVGGHKMTLTVFSQIQGLSLEKLLNEKDRNSWVEAFEEINKNSDFQLLGYVSSKGKYLLYAYEGKLRKSLVWKHDWSYDSSLDLNFLSFVEANVPQLFIAT